jgi:hypothetical protein
VFDKELSDEAFDRLAPPARSQQARRPPGIVKHMRHAFVHIGRMTMNEKKSMDDKDEQQEAPAIDVADELTDEALDRPRDRYHCVGGTNYCV